MSDGEVRTGCPHSASAGLPAPPADWVPQSIILNCRPSFRVLRAISGRLGYSGQMDTPVGLFAASALGFFFGYNIWGEDGALPLAAFSVAIGIAAFREGNKAAKRKVDEHSNVR